MTGHKIKTRTLAIILNHNLPEYTDRLYNDLNYFRANTYDLVVMDNGSQPGFVSQRTTLRLDKNIFWGGALNAAFRMILENSAYDSLLFLNNDIEVNGEIFVSALRQELFSNDLAIVSPCIAGNAQPWKQMQNWGSKSTRIVEWIDNQAPLFHRKIIEEIRQFDPLLDFGWGQEFICFDVCKEKAWKIGVSDHISILHFGKQTLLQKRLFDRFYEPEQDKNDFPIELMDFEVNAMNKYSKFFSDNPLKHNSFEELRKYGLSYSFIPPQIQNLTNNFGRILSYFRKKKLTDSIYNQKK